MCKITIKTIIFLLTLPLVMYNAHAIECGDAVTADIILTEDLNCSTGYVAIEVFADNVTIDLNGFSLTGTSELAGVITQGFDNLTVKNGNISGFYAGINANRSNGLQVNGVAFYELGSGVVSNILNNAIIKNNKFIQTDFGVFIKNSDTETFANGNRIHNNEFYQANVGIEICGEQADGNLITNNLIWKTIENGIKLSYAHRTRITGNQILESGESAIVLSDSSYSTIKGNSLITGKKGLSILTNARTPCLAGGRSLSFKNRFRYNHVFEFETGVQLGLGLDSKANVFKNTITNNKIYDDNVGIYFETDAHQNTTQNAFRGTITPIVDNGVGNTY